MGLGSLKVYQVVEWKSPKTGNLCRVQIRTENNVLQNILTQVEGSALAKACASIMCSELEGETIERVQSIQQDLQRWVEHRISPNQWKGDLEVYQSLIQFLRTDGLRHALLAVLGVGQI